MSVIPGNIFFILVITQDFENDKEYCWHCQHKHKSSKPGVMSKATEKGKESSQVSARIFDKETGP